MVVDDNDINSSIELQTTFDDIDTSIPPTHLQRLDLNKKLKEIEEYVMFRVFDMIKQNKISYTQNTNAIFFKEEDLTDELFYQIYDFVNKSIDQYNLYRRDTIEN